LLVPSDHNILTILAFNPLPFNVDVAYLTLLASSHAAIEAVPLAKYHAQTIKKSL
jgi:hypothetical protein